MIYDSNCEKKLKLSPLQCIETADAIILRRGCTQMKVSGAGAAQAVRLVLDAVQQNGASPKEICSSFPARLHSAVVKLVARLISSRLLVPDDQGESSANSAERNLDVFYWNFGQTTAEMTKRINNVHLVILGVNCISRQLVASLIESGTSNFEVVDVPLLRNLQLFDDARLPVANRWPVQLKQPMTFEQWQSNMDSMTLDCLVATSDFGSTEQMLELNRLCVARKWSFLPVILLDLIGYLGPFVIPGETACYECLYARQNSHIDNCEDRRIGEVTASEGQSVIGFHPSMASILADLATFELTKFYSGALPNWKVGTLIEVKMLIPELKSRKILKIPRCSVCSPLLVRASSAFKKDKSIPISE
jgi:bacteriocin biosynthesis cyclodehydratase domain-containing protein